MDCQHPDYNNVQALDQLCEARRILGYSYVYAFYMFGNEMFADEVTVAQNQVNQNLFEDQQQMLQSEVSSWALSKCFDQQDQLTRFQVPQPPDSIAVGMRIQQLLGHLARLCFHQKRMLKMCCRAASLQQGTPRSMHLPILCCTVCSWQLGICMQSAAVTWLAVMHTPPAPVGGEAGHAGPGSSRPANGPPE